MTTVQVTIAVFFFLFTLSSSRSPLLRSVNDSKPAQVLPITDPSSGSDHDLIELLHDRQPADPTNPIKIVTDSAEIKSDRSSSVPLKKIVRFRAVNRHFRPYTLRIRKISRCQQHEMKPLTMILNPRSKYRGGGAVSFGHDIIFVVGENRDFKLSRLEEKEKERDQNLKRGSGFLKGFRKFLNQFFEF